MNSFLNALKNMVIGTSFIGVCVGFSWFLNWSCIMFPETVKWILICLAVVVVGGLMCMLGEAICESFKDKED